MLKVNKDAHHTILNSGQQRVNIKKDIVFMFAASFVPQTEKRRKKAHIYSPPPTTLPARNPGFILIPLFILWALMQVLIVKEVWVRAKETARSIHQ